MVPNKTRENFTSAKEKKYELFQDDMAKRLGLYRIRALRDFGDVKKGEIGGFVSGEHNLSHDGTCWIGSPAQVTGTSRVSDNARLGGIVGLHGGAELKGNQRIVTHLPDDEPHQDVEP